MRKYRSKKEILYTTWAHMKQRCNNTTGKTEDTKNYYARGISFDPSWNNFSNFWKDMNASWEKGLTLDRVDNNGKYCKENCRWADRKTQAINRRNTKLFLFRGQELTLTDWAPIVGVSRSTLAMRHYCLKWPIEKVLLTAVF